MPPSIGKHIRLYLVDGSPSGIITAEIIGWTGKILSFPRVLLPEALKRPECAKPGIYFLTGFDENYEPLLYIGEGEDVSDRLKAHDRDDKKGFFEQVTLVVSKDENLTKGHIRYLESRIIELANANRVSLSNGNQGFRVSLPEAEQSDMEHIIEQLQILLPVLGLTLLQARPEKKASSSQLFNDSQTDEHATFELSYKDNLIYATAYEANGKFIVEKGSFIRNPDSQEYQDKVKASEAFSKRFSQEYKMTQPIEENPEILQLTDDIAFKSPSGASCFVTGSPSSGNWYWRLKGTGQTYGDWRNEQLDIIKPSQEVELAALAP